MSQLLENPCENLRAIRIHRPSTAVVQKWNTPGSSTKTPRKKKKSAARAALPL